MARKTYKEEELLKICPVCGYDGLEEAPFDTYGYPTYSICSCCGFEYGFDDESEGFSYEEYRREWLKRGGKFKWKENGDPEIWNEETRDRQLENIKLVSHYEPRMIMEKKGPKKFKG